MDKPRIVVIGAGLMGHGIAYLFAAAGHDVRVQDLSSTAIAQLRNRLRGICELLGSDRSLLTRVTGGPSLASAVADADIVIEAAPEKPELKQSLFMELEQHAPAQAILASNTSAIPISRIAAGLKSKQRVLGAHFWNPPHLVPLVQIVLMGRKIAPRPIGCWKCCAPPAVIPCLFIATFPASSATACSTR
jgi:3-hydroxybutyryl-CoA dehydrogenase